MTLLVFAAAWSSMSVDAMQAAGRDEWVSVPAPPPAPPTRPDPSAPWSPKRNPQDLRDAICVMPTRKRITDAYEALPLSSRPERIVVAVRYEDDGVVSDAKIDRSSGDDALDTAVLAWAGGVKLCPGFGSGTGKIPIEFPGDFQPRRPRPDDRSSVP
jgi:TonB family protein